MVIHIDAPIEYWVLVTILVAAYSIFKLYK